MLLQKKLKLGGMDIICLKIFFIVIRLVNQLFLLCEQDLRWHLVFAGSLVLGTNRGTEDSPLPTSTSWSAAPCGRAATKNCAEHLIRSWWGGVLDGDEVSIAPSLPPPFLRWQGIQQPPLNLMERSAAPLTFL